MTARLRIATWNLCEGRPRDGYYRALEQLASLDPDVILLQEVVKNRDVDHVEEVAQACSMEQVNFLPGRSSFRSFFPFLRVKPRSLGEHGTGIGIATRFPVRAWHAHELDTDRSLLTIAPGRIQMDQPRQAIAAELDVDGKSLTVATTHLSWKPGINGDHLRQVEDFVRSLPGPHILGGDFNARANNTRWPSLATADTYPVSAPRTQIDHIVGDGTAIDSCALRLSTSDHLLLMADVEVEF